MISLPTSKWETLFSAARLAGNVLLMNSGKFSRVFEAVDVRSSQRVAVKIIEKAAVDPYSVTKLLRKLEIMRKMNHANGFLQLILSSRSQRSP